jgi:hypothetical protein
MNLHARSRSRDRGEGQCDGPIGRRALLVASSGAMRDPATHLQVAFVRDGRLLSLPRRRPMLIAACEHLARRFSPGRPYSEAEVNALLAEDGPDHATLRRLLVDEGFLRRERGIYWRADAPTPRPA